MAEMTCERCYGTGYYHGEFSGKYYPRFLCDCPAARRYLREYRWNCKLGERMEGQFSLHQVKAVRYRDTGDYFWCDLGIEEDTRLLWAHGIDTEFSCEGGNGSDRYFKLARVQDVKAAMKLLPWAVRTSPGIPAVYWKSETGWPSGKK